MELEIETQTEDTNKAGVATEVEATQTEEQTTEATTEIEAAPAPEPEPQYTPNYKYKFEGAEKEIEEYYRPFIKSADDEKRFRELMEIRDAFPKHKEYSTKYKEIEPHYNNLTSELEELGQLRQKNPLEFMQKLKFGEDEATQQAVLQMAKHILDIRDLTPEQKQAYNEQRRVQEEREQLRQHNQMLQGNLHEIEVKQKSYELDQTLGTKDVKDIADQYDLKVGTPGAFRQKVIQTGQQVFAAKGIDISVQEAVNMVMNEYKPFLSAASNLAAQAPRPKVIPNVSGLSSSPAQTKITSIDQIMKKLSTMED